MRSTDRDGQLPAELLIYGPQGGPASDSITSPSLTDVFGGGEAAVGTLYEIVRRRVLGVDSVISGLLNDLKKSEEASDDDIPF